MLAPAASPPTAQMARATDPDPAAAHAVPPALEVAAEHAPTAPALAAPHARLQRPVQQRS